MSKKNIKNRNKGLCQCGKTPSGSNKCCDGCLTKHKIKTAKNKARGLCSCGKKTKYWWSNTCIRCLINSAKNYKKKSRKTRTLYRPATKEEIKKYGGKSEKEILDSYYNLLY